MIILITVSASTICRTLGCTCQVMHRVALQRSDYLRGEFMSQVSVYDPSMLIFIDENSCDRRDAIRKRGYSIRGILLCDQRIIARGIRYSAIPVVSLEGIHDVFITENTVNGPRSLLKTYCSNTYYHLMALTRNL